MPNYKFPKKNTFVEAVNAGGKKFNINVSQLEVELDDGRQEYETVQLQSLVHELGRRKHLQSNPVISTNLIQAASGGEVGQTVQAMQAELGTYFEAYAGDDSYPLEIAFAFHGGSHWQVLGLRVRKDKVYQVHLFDSSTEQTEEGGIEEINNKVLPLLTALAGLDYHMDREEGAVFYHKPYRQSGLRKVGANNNGVDANATECDPQFSTSDCGVYAVQTLNNISDFGFDEAAKNKSPDAFSGKKIVELGAKLRAEQAIRLLIYGADAVEGVVNIKRLKKYVEDKKLVLINAGTKGVLDLPPPPSIKDGERLEERKESKSHSLPSEQDSPYEDGNFAHSTSNPPLSTLYDVDDCDDYDEVMPSLSLTPSESPAVFHCELATTFIERHEGRKDSIWKDTERQNDYRVLKGVYDYSYEENEDCVMPELTEVNLRAETVMFDILIKLTTDPLITSFSEGKALSLENLKKIIDVAKRKGGVAHKAVNKGGYYEDQRDEEIKEEIGGINPALARTFSALYQKECEECGIYSGRKGRKIVGSRLTFLPSNVIVGLDSEEFVQESKEKGKSNIERRKKKVAQQIMRYSEDEVEPDGNDAVSISGESSSSEGSNKSFSSGMGSR